MTARRLRFTGPRTVEVESFQAPTPAADEVRVRTTVSAISSGTERLVYRGEAPTDLPADPALESFDGDLSFPLSYGYAAVGEVDAAGDAVDPGWHGRRVFAFEPHASAFTASPERLQPVPEGITDAQAALFPTVETAVNFLMDGNPRIGERVGVFGQGMVGLATTALLADSSASELVTVDACDARRERSERLGADRSLPPGADAVDRLREGDPPGRDLVYELSGAPAALDDAIAAAGYDGRVVVGSWYGTKPAELALGGNFHRGRIAVESSQVSTIEPALRGRWSLERRREVAWDRLARIDLDPILTHRIPLAEAGDAYELLEEQPEEAVGVLLTY
ncbi:oxidoreductase [Halorubrum sp. 48-1-W]|uniref:zinc-dependent alcohol dehydrogenase n=1 Tax=Halorubrum sp. 48-1-W TaxID=2249761 RepID=UPI000DCC4DD1|nr:zinc-binding alcohol dehydrogenase [Halorubrum sp. 48-1-W]RAW45001.1 oxidoreductase [Halorubrum sp. 48-1-W]